jgi:GNAT superfamily N-acetyltransferase
VAGSAPHPFETVRKADAADVRETANALARAFYDDPVMNWFFPNNRRMRRLEQGFTVFLDGIYLRYGETYTIDGRAGGALWAPPGKWHVGPLGQLRLLPRMTGAFGRDLPKLMRGITFIESKHPHEPHYYLAVLGVEPESQGRGLGGALMRPVLERCDRERMAAYLEASSERSRALYLRNGFEVVEEIHLPGGGPPAWRMWREPRPKAEA